MLQLVLQHESTKKLHSILKEASQFERQLHIDPIVEEQDLPSTKVAKMIKMKAKKNGQSHFSANWD